MIRLGGRMHAQPQTVAHSLLSICMLSETLISLSLLLLSARFHSHSSSTYAYHHRTLYISTSLTVLITAWIRWYFWRWASSSARRSRSKQPAGRDETVSCMGACSEARRRDFCL
ncbi:hypothetical protein C8F01DRAFT_218627 [Mycena amicta]|nr:hypothetical protein C8F01DRAFT_218627 [Mycena amicta]